MVDIGLGRCEVSNIPWGQQQIGLCRGAQFLGELGKKKLKNAFGLLLGIIKLVLQLQIYLDRQVHSKKNSATLHTAHQAASPMLRFFQPISDSTIHPIFKHKQAFVK